MELEPLTALIISGCVIVEHDTILTLRRINPDWHELPGGKQELGEPLDRTAIREAREELGCDVTLTYYLGGAHFFYDHKEITSHWYAALLENGQTPHVMEPQKFSALARIPLKDYKNYPLSPNLHRYLHDLERGSITLKNI